MLPFFLERITRLARLAFALADTHTTDEQSPGLFFASQRSFRVSHTHNRKTKKGSNECFLFFWSGLRDSLGSLLRSPTRTRPTNSPPDCSLLRNGLFESLIPTTEKQKKEAMNASFLFLERITRLELATFTLAR